MVDPGDRKMFCKPERDLIDLPEMFRGRTICHDDCSVSVDITNQSREAISFSIEKAEGICPVVGRKERDAQCKCLLHGVFSPGGGEWVVGLCAADAEGNRARRIEVASRDLSPAAVIEQYGRCSG